MSMATHTKAVAAGLVLALLTVLAAVSCGPGIGFLTSLVANMQCQDGGGVSTGGEVVPVPSGNPDAKLAFRAASWNVLKSNSVSNVAAGLRQLAGTADVVGLQEFREKFRGPTIKNALPGWAWSNQNTSVPITWNAAKFDLVAKDRVQEFGVTRVAGGPVGRSAGPKFAEWVQLRDRRTGATFVMVNHHLLYNIESKGRPDKRVGTRYLNLAQKQMKVERDLVDRFTALQPARRGHQGRQLGLPQVRPHQAPGQPRTCRPPGTASTPTGRSSAPRSRAPSPAVTRLIDSVSATTALLIPVQQTILGTPRKRFRGSDHRPPVVALTNTGSSIEASLTKPVTAAARPLPRSRQGSVGRVGDLTEDQMRVAQGIYTTTLQVGKEEGWSAADTDLAFQIAVSTAQKESTLGANPRSRRPDGNGDGGIFAQRTKPGWYGTIDQVNDPAYGTRIFLLGKKITAADVAAARRAGSQPAGPAGYTIPGLKQVNGWPRLSISEASHRIQRSAYPQMPAQFEKIARALLQAFDKAGLTATAGDVDQALNSTGCQDGEQAGGGGAGAELSSHLDAGRAVPAHPRRAGRHPLRRAAVSADHHDRHLHRPRPRPHPRRRHHDPQLRLGDREGAGAEGPRLGAAARRPPRRRLPDLERADLVDEAGGGGMAAVRHPRGTGLLHRRRRLRQPPQPRPRLRLRQQQRRVRQDPRR